jgi:hypothetical protein
MSSGTAFALDLQKYVDAYKERADVLVGEIVANVAAEVDMRSPIGDATYWKSKPPKGYVGGRFRANWQLGVGVLNPATTDAVDRSAKGGDGGATTSRIVAAIPKDAAGKVYWLSNSLPYAGRIEHGWSRQAPQGVVGLTAVRFQKIVDDSVARAKARTAK